ncbi:T9SS C-terminal target domain-containing protein, partial [candidate division KSB1 bacterium]
MKHVLTVVVLMLIGQFAAAQTLDDVSLHGTVFGYSVHDTTVLAGAWVRITDISAGQTDSVQTDGSGHWAHTFHTSGASNNRALLPQTIDLTPNYPNPFSNGTTFSLTNPIQQDVRVSIYNILGQKVTELVHRKLQPGYYDFRWDGRSATGQRIAGGIYFTVVHTPNGIKSRKMVLLDPGNGPSGGEEVHVSMFRRSPIGGEGAAHRTGESRTLDDVSVQLEFRYADYDSLILSFTLAEGQDSALVTYLRHHDVLPAGMVFVQAGSYSMGAAYQPPYSLPIHTVHVPAFYIDIYEVTNAQYKVFCDATGRAYPLVPAFDAPDYVVTNPTYANYPVVMVSWDDAKAYAAWRGARLPTEAEWERAAKGNTDNRQWPWGDTWVAGNANGSQSSDGYTNTSPVGHFPNGVSPVGCFDMAGNVMEWCEDDWHASYDGAPTNGSAWIDTPRASNRVLRGGSWSAPDTFLRCGYRWNYSPTVRRFMYGFRCAATNVVNQPPVPIFPYPADGAIGQLVDSVLSWTGIDPDLDPLTYDVYFGTDSTPSLVSTAQSGATYDPGTLTSWTTYYWRIIVYDDHDHTAQGPLWSFTTGTSDSMAGMVLIPGSSYNMGSTWPEHSHPIHTVHVPAFFIDRFEVANAQYKAFCDSTARSYPPDPGFPGMPDYFTDSAYANYPVVNVSWYDACDYAAWQGKRLPTEAEWERAARGNTDNRCYPW